MTQSGVIALPSVLTPQGLDLQELFTGLTPASSHCPGSCLISVLTSSVGWSGPDETTDVGPGQQSPDSHADLDTGTETVARSER